MKLFKLILAVFLLSISLVSSVQSSEMTIKLNENAPAHITISVENPPNAAELQTIINEPRIHEIYMDQLNSVFGNVENLKLSIDSGVFIVDFQTSITKQGDGAWIVEKIDFENKVDPASSLSISLPPDTVLLESVPTPVQSSDNLLEWRDVDFIPQIKYGKHGSFTRKNLKAITLMLFVLASVGYLAWKKKK